MRQNGPGCPVFYVCAKQCKTCIYGPNNPTRKSPQELEAECSNITGYRECHTATLNGNTACCRGSYNAQRSMLLQLAKRENRAVFVYPETMETVNETEDPSYNDKGIEPSVHNLNSAPKAY